MSKFDEDEFYWMKRKKGVNVKKTAKIKLNSDYRNFQNNNRFIHFKM